MTDVVVWLSGYVNILAIFIYLTTINQSLETFFFKNLYLKEKISLKSAKKYFKPLKMVKIKKWQRLTHLLLNNSI